MTIASRLAQTAALILCAPVLWLFGLVTLSLVMVGNTTDSIVKVWRAR